MVEKTETKIGTEPCNSDGMPKLRLARRSRRALPKIWRYLNELDCWMTAEEILLWYNSQDSWGITMNQLGNWLGKNPHAFIRTTREYRISGRSAGSTCKAVRYWRANNGSEHAEPAFESIIDFRSDVL